MRSTTQRKRVGREWSELIESIMRKNPLLGDDDVNKIAAEAIKELRARHPLGPDVLRRKREFIDAQPEPQRRAYLLWHANRDSQKTAEELGADLDTVRGWIRGVLAGLNDHMKTTRPT